MILLYVAGTMRSISIMNIARARAELRKTPMISAIFFLFLLSGSRRIDKASNLLHIGANRYARAAPINTGCNIFVILAMPSDSSLCLKTMKTRSIVMIITDSAVRPAYTYGLLCFFMIYPTPTFLFW